MPYFVADRIQGKGNPWTFSKRVFASRDETLSLCAYFRRVDGREIIRIKADSLQEAKGKLPA
jgi:hypothetical protein